MATDCLKLNTENFQSNLKCDVIDDIFITKIIVFDIPVIYYAIYYAD